METQAIEPLAEGKEGDWYFENHIVRLVTAKWK